MGVFKVKQGKHFHAIPPISTLPWIGSQSMTRLVTFSEDCKYDSTAYNSKDVNKLFGLSFGFGGVHWNSARFGWRWNNTDQCIELLAYVYTNGVRNQDAQLRFPVIAQVKPGQPVVCRLGIHASADYYFTVREAVDNTPLGLPPLGVYILGKQPKQPSFGLTHGLYFGGSQPAPQDIHVTINRT